MIEKCSYFFDLRSFDEVENIVLTDFFETLKSIFMEENASPEEEKKIFPRVQIRDSRVERDFMSLIPHSSCFLVHIFFYFFEFFECLEILDLSEEVELI